VKAMLEKVVSPRDDWRHNDPDHSDCDRHNAHSHLQATLLGHALPFSVSKGKLVLGQFQAIIAAELDGPRNRDLAVQIIGMTLLKPGWDKDYYGRPPVYPVGCAGVVEECRPLEDGRFNIRLKGVSRFRIRSEQGGEPYRLAAVERLTDEIGDAAALESGRERVLAAIGRAADGPSFLVTQPQLPPELFINAVCQALSLSPV